MIFFRINKKKLKKSKKKGMSDECSFLYGVSVSVVLKRLQSYNSKKIII